MWVVDTCVIIDIVRGDREFAERSALAIDSKLDDVLAIAPITYIELAPTFGGDIEYQNSKLAELGIVCDFGGNKDAVLAAYKAWYEHVMRKRTGEVKKRPIADVMIGAYALEKGGLITRNEEDFRSLYPTLRILNPTKMDF